MSKHINQSLASGKKFAAIQQTRGMPKSQSTANMRSLSYGVPAMKELLSSQAHCPSEPDQLQEYPVRFMQHEQDTAPLVQQINQLISNSFAKQASLHQIAQVLGEAFLVDYSLVLATSDEISIQVGCWCANNDHRMPSLQQIDTHVTQIASQLQVASEPLIIDDLEVVESSDLLAWQHLLPLSMRAVLQIPTTFKGKTNGSILLIRSQPYQWSEIEKQQVVATATPVATAIYQFLQSELSASLQQRLNASTHYQNLIYQLTTATRSSLELNQIFQMASSSVARTLQVARSIILTLKYTDPLFKQRAFEEMPQAKATIVCEWHSDANLDKVNTISTDTPSLHDDSNLSNKSFCLSRSWLCQQAFKKSPDPLMITSCDHQSATDSTMEVTQVFNIDCLPALLMLPLESGSKILGFLVLQHSSTRHWHPEEIAFLKSVSAQLSSAIMQNQTLRQVQSLIEDRTAKLQSSLEVQNKLYKKTRQQIDQLRQLNQLKDEFLSTMSHELRTPLTSMSLAIRMLRQPGITIDRQTRYLDILQEQCSQEIDLVNDLLKLQELESSQNILNLETVDLTTKIHCLSQSFEQKWSNKGLNIALHLPAVPLSIETDSESIERILTELLTNAGKYSQPDTTIILGAVHRVDQQVNQIVLTVTNYSSRGISPEESKYIFDKFRRGEGVTQQAIQGTGLGLALVKCLVQYLNGTIAVTSSLVEPGSFYKTCFTLTLPQIFAQAQS